MRRSAETGRAPVVFIREMTPLATVRTLVLDDLLVDELLENGFFTDGAFSFVGVYYSTELDVSVIGYPKYMKDYSQHRPEEILDHVEMICRVIAKARSGLERSLVDDSYAFSAYASESSEQYVSTFDLANFILDDYVRHGVYVERRKQVTRNRMGPIEWNRTIARTQPLVARDVVYVETLHQYGRKTAAPLITSLHTWIINECGQIVQAFGSYPGLELPDVQEVFDSDSLEEYVPFILSKLPYVYNEREIDLLKALASWCGKSRFHRVHFGVTSYEVIWEHAIDKVFGNIDDTSSGSPTYVIEGQEYAGRGELRPDTIRIYVDETLGKAYIGILDAKYYVPFLERDTRRITGMPTNVDIAKQVGYYRYLRQQYPGDDVEFANAFLMPHDMDTDTGLVEYFGYGTLSERRNREIDKYIPAHARSQRLPEEPVLLYRVNPKQLYKAYLERRKITDASFMNNFVGRYRAVKDALLNTDGREAALSQP